MKVWKMFFLFKWVFQVPAVSFLACRLLFLLYPIPMKHFQLLVSQSYGPL